MPCTFVGRGDQVAVNSTSITVTPPAGLALTDGDLKLVQLSVYANVTITPPAGWTVLGPVAIISTHRLIVAFRFHVAGDANPAFTISGGVNRQMLGTMSAHRGVHLTDQFDGIAPVGSGSGAASGFIGPDIGNPVRAFARIVTFASTDGTNALALDPNASVPMFTAYGGADYDTANGSQGCAFHDRGLPDGGQSRVHHFQAASGTPTWNMIAMILRPIDSLTAAVPPSPYEGYNGATGPGVLYGLPLQTTPTTWGVRCSPLDTDHEVHISVQAFKPFDDDAGYWDEAYWDEDAWGGVGRWVDVSERVRGATWTLGADTPGGRPRVGTGSVDLANADGDCSPWATDGDFADNGESWLHAGTLMRIVSVYTSTAGASHVSLTNFTGRVERIDEHTEQGADAWVTLTLVEPISRLATFNGLEQAVQGTGDSFDDRITRLLVDAGWEFSFYLGTRPDSATTGTLQGTNMAGERLSELYLTGDSVGCYVYGHPDGSGFLNVPSVSSSVLTFSNAPQGDELPLARDAVTPYSNNDRLLNVAIGARAGGTEQNVADAVSITKFGRFDNGNGWPRRDLICESDDTLAEVLADAVAQHAFDDKGIASIEIDCDLAPTVLYWRLAATQLFRNVNVRWVHPSGNELTFTAYLEAMTNRLTMEGKQMKWTATWNLAFLDRS